MVSSPNSRPRPLVLVALDAPTAPALRTLAARHPHVTARLDEVDTIDAGALAHNPVVLAPFKKAKDLGGRVHLFGLVSDGGVHGSIADLYALIDIAKAQRVRVVVHAILDGVDVPPKSYARYIAELEQRLDGGTGRIGTVSGRGFAMDVDGRWDRIEKVSKVVMADGAKRLDSARAGIEEACMFGAPEAFVEPFIVFDYPGVSPVDTALHASFGSCRARALSAAMGAANFPHFGRKNGRAPFQGRFTCMTPYDDANGLPTAFPRAPDPSGLPLELLAAAKLSQHHVTKGSPKELAASALAALSGAGHDFVLVDFASPGNATRKGACDALDGEVLGIVDAALAAGGAALVLGGRDAHNTAPLVFASAHGAGFTLRNDGSVGDLAPTLLALLGLPQPDDVEGSSLIVRA